MGKLRIGVLVTSATLALTAGPAAWAASGPSIPVKTAIGRAITITRAKTHKPSKRGRSRVHSPAEPT